MKFIVFLISSRYRAQHLNNLAAFNKFENLYSFAIIGVFADIFEPVLNLLSKITNKVAIVYSDDEFSSRKGVKRLRWNNLVELNGVAPTKIDFFVCRQADPNCRYLQLYPIRIKKPKKIRKKIVFIGEINLNVSEECFDIWNKYKLEILGDLSLINSQNFWRRLKCENEIIKRDIVFIELSNLIRFELVKLVHDNFENFELVGDSWRKEGLHSLPNNYRASYRKKLYSGAICLDFGSKSFGGSLFQRTIEIVESGGILFQAIRDDSNEMFGLELEERITYRSVDELLKKLRSLLLGEVSLQNDLSLLQARMDLISKIRLKEELEKLI